MGTVRILHREGTISLQAAVHPKYKLGALNMKEEEPLPIQLFLVGISFLYLRPYSREHQWGVQQGLPVFSVTTTDICTP